VGVIHSDSAHTLSLANIFSLSNLCLARSIFQESTVTASKFIKMTWETSDKVMGNSAKVGYLHDGRARNLTEAILWHGGEADRSRQRFQALSATDRDALLAFLKSL